MGGWTHSKLGVLAALGLVTDSLGFDADLFGGGLLDGGEEEEVGDGDVAEVEAADEDKPPKRKGRGRGKGAKAKAKGKAGVSKLPAMKEAKYQQERWEVCPPPCVAKKMFCFCRNKRAALSVIAIPK